MTSMKTKRTKTSPTSRPSSANPTKTSSLLKKVFEVSLWATLIQDPSARRTKDSQPSGFGFEYCASHVRFRVFQQTARRVGGRRCEGTYGITMSARDWKRCSSCSGLGFRGDRRCNLCWGTGWAYVGEKNYR